MTRDEQQLRQTIDLVLSRIRQDVETHLETLAMELLRVVERRDVHGAPDVKKAAVEIARAVAKGGDQARQDLMARLADAVRGLDDAGTLRSTMEALGRGAAAEAQRVAVLLVDDETLRNWGHYGFAAGQGPVDFSIAASPLIAASIRMRQVNLVPPAGSRPDPSLPAFMRVPPGCVGQVIPLVVGGQVVAVVYADGPERPGDALGPAVWTEHVEVLVRHAAARLENLTTRRAVEVLTTSA
ncbi:MAG: hypothetical protein R2752_12395 [Vicinamibacterales bacterium]